MSALISSVTAAALAAALSGPGAAVAAAGPAPHPPPHPTPVIRHQPPPAPHWFRARFGTQAQCQARAGHDHPGRSGDWDCRRGPDRAHPWEYWGR